jgi:flagellar basal-body rod protein FlgB
VKISIDNALGPHAAALALRSDRSQLLAENIANADTPGYKARDIDFSAALAQRLEQYPGKLNTTHEKHLSARGNPAQGPSIRQPLMDAVDRNGVNVQQEQAAFAENTLQLQTALDFVGRRFKGLISAIKGE